MLIPLAGDVLAFAPCAFGLRAAAMNAGENCCRSAASHRDSLGRFAAPHDRCTGQACIGGKAAPVQFGGLIIAHALRFFVGLCRRQHLPHGFGQV